MYQALTTNFTFVKDVILLLKRKNNLVSCGQWPPAKKCARGVRLSEYSWCNLIAKDFLTIPKGMTPKIHGSILNVSASVSETCTQLSREGSCEEVILLKLKKKLSFKGNVSFESVRTYKVRAALEHLQRVNPLYYDVLIRDVDINQDL